MYAAPIASHTPLIEKPRKATRIRHARVHTRFCGTTRYADFHAATTASAQVVTDSTLISDHGRGSTLSTRRAQFRVAAGCVKGERKAARDVRSPHGRTRAPMYRT